MNRYARYIVYSAFVKNLAAATRLLGVIEIENNDRKVQGGLEAAVKKAVKNNLKLGFKPEKIDSEIFWRCGYSSGVLNPSDRDKKMVRLGYNDEEHALRCLRFGGPEPADVDAYKRLARTFIKDIKYTKK